VCFANVRQKWSEFANVWQNTTCARQTDLPMFGKNGPNLPNIGKMQKPRGVCRASTLLTSLLLTSYFAVAAAAALAKRLSRAVGKV
jgi:hypothetical protein